MPKAKTACPPLAGRPLESTIKAFALKNLFDELTNT